jgi:hypothetical protein
MASVVAFALEVLKGLSPVGSSGDHHPGLYRDSHLVFIDGHVVKDVSGWQPGQQVNISNPVPYARKIEVGGSTISVPHHVYEKAESIVAARYGNSVNVQFVFMPVRFGSVADYAQSLAGQAAGTRRGGSQKALRDWLVRQPALQITAR